jgi:hypothetical protein
MEGADENYISFHWQDSSRHKFRHLVPHAVSAPAVPRTHKFSDLHGAAAPAALMMTV